MERVVGQLTDYLDEASPGGLLGLYLTGSAAMSGLQPNSDIDFVLVTQRSLTPAERRRLLAFLTGVSNRVGEPARPLELTSVAVADIVPWTYPATCDFLFGEWLRERFAHGSIPEPQVSPDLAITLTTLLRHHQVLLGAAPGDLLDSVPTADLRRAILESLPPLLADLVGDERNVLLTLARMLVTMSTGEIVSKDEAVHRIGPDLPDPDRMILSRAAAGHIGHGQDDWASCHRPVQETADHLATIVRTSGESTGRGG